MVYVVEKEKVSKTGSMKGWDWKRWLSAHWLDVKKALLNPSFLSIFKPVAKYLISFAVVHYAVDGVVFETLLTIVGKSVFDLLDFWFSNVKLE